MPAVPGFADSLADPGNLQRSQRHWIGATPMEAELTRDGRAEPGLARPDHAPRRSALLESPASATLRALPHRAARAATGGPGPAELQAFTLNTSIVAVGEGNYGRLGPDAQRRWTTAPARPAARADEQPGAMPEIAPSPTGRDASSTGRSTERPMVLQAWGAYGTAWPVVHQQLGVRPDLGRGASRSCRSCRPTSAASPVGDIRLGGRGGRRRGRHRSGGAYGRS